MHEIVVKQSKSAKALAVASFALGVADAFLNSGGSARKQARKTAEEIRSDAGNKTVDRLTHRRAHEVRLKNPGYFRAIGYNDTRTTSWQNLRDSVSREFGYPVPDIQRVDVDGNSITG